MLKYSIWALAPLIGAAAMLSFLYFRDHGGESFEPPAAVGEQGQPVAAEKLQEARDFKEWPLWWVGESSQSLPLTSIQWATPEQGFPDQNSVSFQYGTCTPPPDGGCVDPLSIQIEPLCWTPPDTISSPGQGDIFDFRGAKALWVGDHLRIWTGDSAIAIFGHPRERIDKAAEEILPLGNLEVELVDSKLPPPNFDSCPEIPLYPTSPPLPTRIPTPQTATP
jgi:hypothetical protein